MVLHILNETLTDQNCISDIPLDIFDFLFPFSAHTKQ